MHVARVFCRLECLAAVVLLACTPPRASGRAARSKDHRVIVRFAERGSQGGDRDLLEGKVQELSKRSGVLGAKGLFHVGLAVVDCESLDAEDQLVQELEGDPLVELATLDTRVYFDGASRDGSDTTSRGAGPPKDWPPKDLRQCSAQSGCAALALVGDCCPAMDGTMLACCDGPTPENLVTLRSFHGKYVVAESWLAVAADRDAADAWEQFHLYYNADGTVSLRSYWGTYIGVGAHGSVAAHSRLMGPAERFHLIWNEDSTVSLKTFLGTYLVAELNGMLRADRWVPNDWEKFHLAQVGTPTQRFPNDANFTALWGMHNDDCCDIDAPEAWKTFTGEFSAGITVAVIDTGIDYTHEDIAENMWVNPGEIPDNGVDDDGNGYIDDVHGVDFKNEDGDPMDDQKHGTHCAGTIAAVGNNGVGVSGVAWHGVRLMALKFLDSDGSGQTSDAIEAIDYAVAHGARILSNSWGGGGSNAALRTAVERAGLAGVLFVAAAGNSGDDNDELPHYPSSYASDAVLAVASTDSAGNLSGFSCYGASSVDLAAPGTKIYSTVPRQGYVHLSGTSMATPHVSGLAALVWMYRPSLSMAQVKEIVMGSVDRTPALEGKVATGGRINARRALEAASSARAPRPPLHSPLAVAFADVNPKIGLIDGVVTITAAADESDVDYYKVYIVSRAGYQLDAVGTVSATGARFLEVAVKGPLSLPRYAVGFVAVSGNASGEMPAQIGGRSPNITVEDFVMPEMGPRVASWGGDVDLRKGFVAGRLAVTRAADEASVTHYNIYWSNASGSRGPWLGSLPSANFLVPKCGGAACAVISQTNITGGYRFDRRDYGNNEEATIVLSGPATVRLTRFDTERYYDSLIVGIEEFTGQPRVPQDEQLHRGRALIKWFSDDSMTASGWTFDVFQSDTHAYFQLPPSPMGGRGLEVFAAHGKTEQPKGSYVEIVDHDRSMPPSPAFAPLALSFSDVDVAPGVIAGTAELTPAANATDKDVVSYYRLDFATAQGEPLEQIAHVTASGGPVRITVPSTPVPRGAAKLVARCGNAAGLGRGQVALDIVDVGQRSAEAARSVPRGGLPEQEQQKLEESPAARGKSARRPDLEPWLHRNLGVHHTARVIWEGETSTLSLADRARHGRIRGIVSIHGLKSHAATAPQLHRGLEKILAATLPGATHGGVAVRRVLVGAEDSAPTATAGVQAAAAGGSMLEFEVSQPLGAPVSALDRMEARLMLLSRGGRAAQHLQAALLAEFAEAGMALPAGTRISVSEPWQMPSAKAGRKLAAKPLDDPLDGKSIDPWDSEDPEVEASVDATVMAGLLAVLAVGWIIAARCREKRARKLAEQVPALDGVRVEALSRAVEPEGILTR